MNTALEWDGLVPVGAELADPRKRPRVRQRVPKTLALVCALAFHGALLTLWRTSAPVKVFSTVGEDGGAGGIALSLVRGGPGGAFQEATVADERDPAQARGKSPALDGAVADSTSASGKAGSDAEPLGEGHDMGGVGEGAEHQGSATTGSGYDPGAFASLAPLSFSSSPASDLWAQVRRCYSAPNSHGLAINVLLDAHGVLLEADRNTGALVTSQSVEDERVMAAAIDAVRVCGPYPAWTKGYAGRFTVLVPAAPDPAASAPPAAA